MPAGSASLAAALAAVDLANRQAGSAAYASRWLETGDRRCHAVEAGHGPTLLFVHGFPSFWYCWIRQLEALRQGHRVVALDALGAGASDRPDRAEDYTIEALVGWLQAAIAALAPAERVILIGHDWGAALCFALAQAAPQMLAGVIGIAAPPYAQFAQLVAQDPEQQARSHYMDGLRRMDAARAAEVAGEVARSAYAGLHGRGEIDSDEAALFEQACGDPPAFLAGCRWYGANLGAPAGAIAPRQWASGTAPLTVPALLIWGNADQTFVPQAPEQFQRDNPGAQTLRLDGIGHWCMLEAPERCSAAIADFAARLGDPRKDQRA